MIRIQSNLSAGLLVVATLLPIPGWAKPNLEGRVEVIEQQLRNQFNVDTLNKLDELQQEILELRGQIEEQSYELNKLRESQQTLYKDLDRRLSNLNKDQKTDSTRSAAANPEQTKAVPEEQLYQSAYNLIEKKNFAEAETAFEDFLWQHPNGKYAPNAYYWLGEIYLASWHKNKEKTLMLDKSINAFSTILDRYKKHHKVTDAMLKLGLIEIDRQNWQAAKQYLSDLKKNYPDTSGARIAESKLQRLEQEGKL